jgi:hypothetical protein
VFFSGVIKGVCGIDNAHKNQENTN